MDNRAYRPGSWMLALAVMVSFAATPCWAELVVKTTDDGAVAENDIYRLIFESAGNLSSITFKDTGRTINSHYLHADALTLKPGTAYSLRSAEAELSVKAGPAGQQLVVEATYNTNQKDPASRPVARYVYTFQPDSPLVRVQAVVEQSTAHHWLLARVNQLNFTADRETAIFTQWATGEDAQVGTIAGSEGVQKSTNWKALYSWSLLLSDAGEAVGLFNADPDTPRSFIYIYSPGRYYLNGSYGKWNSKRLEADHYWYFGTAKDGYSSVCQEFETLLFGAGE